METFTPFEFFWLVSRWWLLRLFVKDPDKFSQPGNLRE
jgi:hypothetical protein